MENINVQRRIELRSSQRNDDTKPSTSSSRGRPKKDYHEFSKRLKRRRLAELSKLDPSAVNKLLNDSNSSLTSVKIDAKEVLSLIHYYSHVVLTTNPLVE